jgi:hypothetical protein
VSGGSIVSLLTNEKVNDIDVYFRSKSTAKRIAEYYIKSFLIAYEMDHGKIGEVKVMDENEKVYIYIKSSGILVMNKNNAYQYFETVESSRVDAEIEKFIEEAPGFDQSKGKYLPICITKSAITLTDKIQLIIRFNGKPEEITKNFDFIHVKSYFDYKENKLVIPEDTSKALLVKELIFNDSVYPLSTLFRLKKMIKRGYKVSAGQILKIALKLQEYDLTNVSILEDQLIGVDAAYFNELLDALKDVKKTEKLDRSYICTIIDKIF